MKKISLLPIIFVALFALSACSSAPTPPPIPTPPIQKPVNSVIPSSVTVPPAGQRVCERGDSPVCGRFQVQCFRAPCPPIDTTYPNICEAEKAGATDIVEGACKGASADNEPVDLERDCISNNGSWLSKSKECEGVSKEACEKLGGTFNECASACRNDPKAEVCTMQCVIVCQFPSL
jgi:hypothetical protein